MEALLRSIIRIIVSYWAVILGAGVAASAFAIHWALGLFLFVCLAVGVGGALTARRRQGSRPGARRRA